MLLVSGVLGLDFISPCHSFFLHCVLSVTYHGLDFIIFLLFSFISLSSLWILTVLLRLHSYKRVINGIFLVDEAFPLRLRHIFFVFSLCKTSLVSVWQSVLLSCIFQLMKMMPSSLFAGSSHDLLRMTNLMTMFSFLHRFTNPCLVRSFRKVSRSQPDTFSYLA